MANEQFVSRYRKYGEEQPYWKAGIFKIRLPFVHYKWSVPEMVQAVFMCATCLGAIPVLQEVLGVSYGVALSMVIINGFFYNLHVLLGDPVVPGWITPAIPIITAFLTDGYEMGPERTQALIAMQLILGLIFLVFGIAGIGTMLSTITAATRGKDVMLALLFVPVIFPLLYACVSATTCALVGGDVFADGFFTSLALGAGYDVIMILASWVLYDFVVN